MSNNDLPGPISVVILESTSKNESVEVTVTDPTLPELMDAFFRFLKGAGYEPPQGALGIDFYYGEGVEEPSEDGELH